MTVDQNGMNILMVDSEVTWRGGEGQVALLMRGLRDDGFSVTLAAAGNSAIADRARSLHIECVPLSISGGVDVSAALSLARLIHDREFDIVHAHSSHAHSAVFMATRSGRRPIRVVSRRVDFPVARNGLSALKYRYGADIYIAISNGVRDVLIAGGVTPERIAVVRSGVDLARFANRRDNQYLYKEFDLGGETLVVGNVAALAPHKSQVDLIRAAALVVKAIGDVRFLIVGSGELRSELEELIDELGLRKNVTLTGFRNDVVELLATFDCFVLSSYLEGLCTSVMDAQAMGVPVVATRTGGVPDIVEHEKTGLLVPPREPEALAAAIMRMLGDAGVRRVCREAALRQASAYDYRVMVERTVEVYRRALRGQVAIG